MSTFDGTSTPVQCFRCEERGALATYWSFSMYICFSGSGSHAAVLARGAGEHRHIMRHLVAPASTVGSAAFSDVNA